MRVLIVTPNNTHREVFKTYLRRLPYGEYAPAFRLETLAADDGVTAFKTVQAAAVTSPLDLIITAQVTKGITGIQLASYLRTDEKLASIPIVMFNHTTDFDNLLKIKDLGVDSFLLFPVSFEIFREKLTKMVERAILREDAVRKAQLDEYFRREHVALDGHERDRIYIESLARVNKIKSLAPWSTLAQMQVAKIHCGMNNFEAATPLLKSIVKRHFYLQSAHKLLMLCYKRLGKIYEEAPELEMMLKRDPQSAETHLKLGEVYFRSEEYELARQRFEDAIRYLTAKDVPRIHAESHVGLGKTLARQADLTGDASLRAKAAGELETGRAIDPNLFSAYVNLVTVLRQMGKKEEAQATYDTLLKLTPKNPEDWLALFAAYLQQGDTAQARAALDRAMSRDPENQTVMVDAAVAYMRQNMYDEALKLFEQASVVNPSDKRFYNFMGICHRRAGRHALALETYEHALAIDDKDGSIHFNRGRVFEELFQTERAREEYQAALFFDPGLVVAAQALERLNH